MKYFVRWEVPVEAESAEEAARIATADFFLNHHEIEYPIVEVSQEEIGVRPLHGEQQFDVDDLWCRECTEFYCECEKDENDKDETEGAS